MKTLKQIRKIDFIKLAERIFAAIAIVASLTLPFATFADLPAPGCGTLNGVNCNIGSSPTNLIITVINILLGIAFLVAVLFLIIGGFRYIFSAGNEEAAEKGRHTVVNALIGIAIIILSYVIVQIVSRTVSSGTVTTF